MPSDPNFDMQLSTNSAGATVLTPTGTISESTDLVPPERVGTAIVVDGSRVERINSMGVRNWLAFMKALERFGVPIMAVRLSPALVIQASMISTFLGSARVESFLAPYFCPDCEHTEDRPFGVTDDLPEAIPCPKCGSEMEFDSERDAYLAFRD